jgi:pilus assembly protein Flp/PilA
VGSSSGGWLRSRVLRDTRGAGLVEYLLIVGLIALVAFAGFSKFGSSILGKVGKQAQCVETFNCGVAYQGSETADLPPIDASVPAAVQEAAKFSPTVRAAIEAMNEHGITISTGTAGGGSYYSGGAIVLDPNSGLDADTFVHEMNHAIYDQEGRHANVDTMGRQEYIDAAIAEEIEGSVQGAQAVYELLQAGQTVPKPSFFDAYEKGIADLLATNPAATPEEQMAAGREGIRQRFHDAFYNGEFVTSTTGVPYPDYYGQGWDDAHPPKQWWEFWK